MSGIKTNIEALPNSIKTFKQFVVWSENRTNVKQPSSPISGFNNWSNNLVEFDTAVAYAEQRGLGIGLAFTGQNHFYCIDIDGCVDFHSGKIEPWALAVVASSQSYTEVSLSFTGLHIICNGHVSQNLKPIEFGKANADARQPKVEFKTVSGYIALTGFIHPQLRSTKHG